MNIRSEKIKNLITHEIMNLIILDKIKDPRITKFITITKITLSKDKHYAHIYITTDAEEKIKQNAVQGLNSAKGFIQKMIAKNLQLRYTPKLEFRIDKQEDESHTVDALLKQIADEKI